MSMMMTKPATVDRAIIATYPNVFDTYWRMIIPVATYSQ
jgi:hypothetical protein